MLFNSYIFILLFLPFVAAIYFLAGTFLHRKLSISWLVVSSLFFYAWWNPIYLPLIIGSVLFNFYVGAAIRRGKSKNAAYNGLLLFFGIAANLLLLGYFKYFNFFIANLNALFNTDISIAPIVLPLAISFFTFQQIMYLVDADSRDTEDYDLVHYTLFVTFFPHLLAGPLVHHAQMMPQFDSDETYRPRRSNIEIGLSIFAIGLFKKVILADNLAAFATPIFDAADAGESLSVLASWQGAVAFTLQIYFDFSGYSDMAIGSARLFGIKLPINFYSPFKSLNIPDFWRRWHMTLTQLITAYVYTPMSIAGARKAMADNSGERAIFLKSIAYPAMVTFLLIGIWHGAGWNYIIFGALHGVMTVANNIWRQFRKHTLKHDLRHSTLAGRILARSITCVCFILSLVFFKAGTTSAAISITESMAGLNGSGAATGSHGGAVFLTYAVICFSIIFLLPNTQQLFAAFDPSLEPKRKETLWGFEKLTWAPNWQWAVICSSMFALALMNMGQEVEFVYFQF
jgi:alginate O-acetyltransferase complex protein AlgI